MPKLMFVWLGSGRSKRRKIGLRGCLLDRAAAAGLPVPPGAVVLDEFFRLAEDHGLVSMSSSRVVIEDPLVLHATLFDSAHLPRFDRPVLVQPVLAETHQSTVDPLDWQSPIASDDPVALGAALARAWSQAAQVDQQGRYDVLLLEAVPAKNAGRVRSFAAAGADAVEFVTPGVAVTAPGSETVRRLDLPRLASWRLPNEALSDYAQRLQMLMRGVRRTFGRGDWLVSWADDGQVCWLVDIQALSEEP